MDEEDRILTGIGGGVKGDIQSLQIQWPPPLCPQNFGGREAGVWRGVGACNLMSSSVEHGIS